MQKLPLYKSHYSLGKSILTLNKPAGNIDQPSVSIVDLVVNSKLDFMCLVEDNMTSFLEASKHCQDKKLKLIYGLRLDVTENSLLQDEASLKKRAKYIIFAKNNDGYRALIKIWSFAAKEGFYYNPTIDFKHLKQFWNSGLTLAVPFYDSFLHSNAFEAHVHVPELDTMKPVFILESNDLPFDPLLRKKAVDYAERNNFQTLEAQSIFYKSKFDFISYLTFRCISNRTNIEKPEFNHLGSDSFNYERWLTEYNK